jgi:hypothetical protein
MQETLLDALAQLLHPLLRPQCTISQIRLLLSFIQNLQFSHRKQLITLCRGMSNPYPGTTLYAKTSACLHEIEAHKLESLLEPLYTNHLYNGLIIALCISMPMTVETIRQTYRDLLNKEVRVMESSPLPSALNYNCFFGEYSTPIHPSLEPNPRQAHAIHTLIDRWIESLESKPFIIPHITNKLCSKATQDLVKDRYPDYLTFEEEGATQADLEYLYMTYGDLLENSPCEIKQRWYTSQLNPRTYYAAGSEAYHRSKYLRDALNSLCDFLPPTERFSRVNPHRIVLSSPQSHAIIYDLTSFTSNMHEQRHWLERLSIYCRGRTVRVLDACEGVVEMDLGELLCSYNQLNNQSTYASDRFIGKGLELAHHVAGFLGVYGNLASCTFLHGAVMCQIVDSFSQIGVAGDDGLVDSTDDYTTFFAIRLLGLAEESKGYNTIEFGNQVYLKRPIRQIRNRVFADSFALYSMIEHLFDEDDKRFFQAPRSILERKSSLAASIVSYLRSLSRLTLSEEETHLVYDYLVGIYRHAGFPLCGFLPQTTQTRLPSEPKLPSTLIPTLDPGFIGKDPIEMTTLSLYDGVAVLPDTSEESIPIDYGLCYAGCEFEATSSGLLSYYRKLGFVELEQGSICYSGEDGLNRLLSHFSPTRTYAKYTVKVLMDIPVHLQT